MHLIEIAGPPGVGKSTLVAELRTRGVLGRPEVAHIPPCAAAPSFLSAGRADPGWHREAVRSFNRCAGIRSYEAEGVAVDDHGTCQRGLDLIRVGSLADVIAYFREIPLPMAAAFCTADPETIERRNRERAAVTDKPDSGHEAGPWLNAAWSAYYVLQGRGARAVALDMGKSIAANAAAVMALC